MKTMKRFFYVCGAAGKNFETSNLTIEDKKKWEEKLNELAQKGLRIVASAHENIKAPTENSRFD